MLLRGCNALVQLRQRLAVDFLRLAVGQLSIPERHRRRTVLREHRRRFGYGLLLVAHLATFVAGLSSTVSWMALIAVTGMRRLWPRVFVKMNHEPFSSTVHSLECLSSENEVPSPETSVMN